MNVYEFITKAKPLLTRYIDNIVNGEDENNDVCVVQVIRSILRSMKKSSDSRELIIDSDEDFLISLFIIFDDKFSFSQLDNLDLKYYGEFTNKALLCGNETVGSLPSKIIDLILAHESNGDTVGIIGHIPLLEYAYNNNMDYIHILHKYIEMDISFPRKLVSQFPLTHDIVKLVAENPHIEFFTPKDNVLERYLFSGKFNYNDFETLYTRYSVDFSIDSDSVAKAKQLNIIDNKTYHTIMALLE